MNSKNQQYHYKATGDKIWQRYLIAAVLWLVLAALTVTVYLESTSLIHSNLKPETTVLEAQEFLSTILMCTVSGEKELATCLDKADRLLSEIKEALSKEKTNELIEKSLDKAVIADVNAGEAEAHAKHVFQYLWKRKAFRDIAQKGFRLPSLLKTGHGGRLGALCLYVYILERLDIPYTLLYQNYNISLIVNSSVVDVCSPNGFTSEKAEIEPESLSVGRQVDLMFLAAVIYASEAYQANLKSNYSRGMLLCNQGLKFAPRYSALYASKGMALLKLEDTERACRYFEKAVSYDPDRYSAHILIGNCRYRLGDLHLAERHWNQAIKIAGDHRTSN